jgi:hypothetical protein
MKDQPKTYANDQHRQWQRGYGDPCLPVGAWLPPTVFRRRRAKPTPS